MIVASMSLGARPDIAISWISQTAYSSAVRFGLVAARHELKTLQFDVMVQKNFLKPDLRFLSSYGVDALGTQLDGNGQLFDQSLGRFKSNNAFRVLSSMHYNDWDIGLLYNVPLGFRFEHAAVRRARLALAQGFLAVKRELGNLPFIAEDLGYITPDVHALRDEFHLPGMRVLQFAFDGHSDNPHLPHNYTSNTTAYTGTHDNPPSQG